MIKRIAMALLITVSVAAGQEQAPLTDRERALLERVESLERRLAALEARENPQPAPAAPSNSIMAAAAPKPETEAATPSPASGMPAGTTIDAMFDGYYGYNFNAPIGRANLLRAYDVSSNSFSIGQADVIIESAADVEHGKRWGARVDLQFGQATQTLQGASSNELRPDIYRNIFQAYGTYVIPIGSGLTVDFGKFASSLGAEGNYTKDQLNYSRSYLFNHLPFYHSGIRANYKFNDLVAVNYWSVNGAQQTEADNGFKDSYFNVTLTPRKSINWTVNYYLGQEHPDVIFYPNGPPAGAPQNLPALQGVGFQPIVNPPTGKLHIFDSYVTWQATPKLSFIAEGDYVIERDEVTSAPQHVSAGAGYARYQLTGKMAVAGRGEYLSDRGGLFSGTTQALKEVTFTWEYKLADGFLLRDEYRRDFSNQPYFFTNTAGVLRKSQDTATMGLIYWFGGKQGAW